MVENENKIHILDWGITDALTNQERNGTLHYYQACGDKKKEDVVGF